MKKYLSILLALVLVLSLSACNKNSMNYIIENEPSMTGIVKEVSDTFIMVEGKTELDEQTYLYKVSLEVENKDSMTHFSVGDEVSVYYNGEIAESDPAQINTVYAITLQTPADREINNQP